MSSGSAPSADDFDQWYANMIDSPAKDEITERHLGLPAHVLSTGLLTWDAIAEVTAALRLSPGQVLLDLACGRGGYGLEVAGRSGAQLVGVDFSPEAVRQAREQAQRLVRVSRFAVGDLTSTGLDAASVDAVMCVDAVQFAVPPEAAYREMHRVLVPGGRVVLTNWEPVDPQDRRLPERLRMVDLRAGLTAAGFVEIEVDERPDWQAMERTMWEEAAALDLGEPGTCPPPSDPGSGCARTEELGACSPPPQPGSGCARPGEDAALRSFHEEGVRVLEFGHLSRRVMASATAG